jgi:SAM-dependent methyltransferase
MATEATALPSAAARNRDVRARVAPSWFQHDYLVLRLLHRDITRALAHLPGPPRAQPIALDVGAGGAPYQACLKEAGYAVRTLDIEAAPGVDVVGTAEDTAIAEASIDLILCTQVLEHVRAPWLAMREFARVLRPGGVVVFSVPHVWFHHPHPHDYWRMTVEGVVALCEEGGFRVRGLTAQGGSAAAWFQVTNFLAYGLLGRLGAPLYATCNALGRVADALVRDQRFALNYLCVATRDDDPTAAELRP